MAWRRLYITVEGQTERKFADEVLQPHLKTVQSTLKSPLLVLCLFIIAFAGRLRKDAARPTLRRST